MVNGWFRHKWNVVLLVGMVVLFVVVFWIGWRAAANAHESEQAYKNATLHLCISQTSYNELLDKLANQFQTAGPQQTELRQQLFYLILADTFSDGMVEPRACQKLLVDNREK